MRSRPANLRRAYRAAGTARRQRFAATAWLIGLAFTACVQAAAPAAELASEPDGQPTQSATQQAPQAPTLPRPEAASPADPAPVAAAETPPPPPPPGWPPEPGEDRATISFHGLRYSGGRLTGAGGVSVKTGDLTMRAEEGSLDENRQWAEFRGDVSIETPGARSLAETLRVNLDTEQWDIGAGRTTIQPEFFGKGQVTEPLYVRARQIRGEAAGGPIHGLDGLLTSCSLEDPHFDLRTDEVTVIPGRKVRIRRPTLYVLGHRIARFPFDLTFDLDRAENRFLPEIGQNDVEGFYAKLAFLYLAGAAGEGFLRLNLTQRRGVGFGVDHTIDTDRQFGRGSVFFEPSQAGLSARIAHRFRFSDEFNSDLTTSYQRNSGYSGDSSTLSSNLMLVRSVEQTRTELGLQRSETTSSYSETSSFSTSLRHQQGSADNRLSLRVATRDSRYGTLSRSSDSRIETELRWTRRGAVIDLEGLWQRQWDRTDRPTGSAGSYAINRTPEVTLRTDSDRLGALELFGRVRTQSTLLLGRIQQEPEATDVYRATLDSRFSGKEYRLVGSAQARHTLDFRQSFYSDGSAQYGLGFASELRQRIGDYWNQRLSYIFADTDGFSPVRLDYTGKYHDIFWQAVRLAPNSSRLELSTGFDFINNRWRDALLRFELMTSAVSKLELQSGYSVEQGQWRPTNLRWLLANPNRLYLSLGANYDIAGSRLVRVTTDLDWKVSPLWRVELAAGYSGFTHTFDTLDLQITRDLHCWVATLSYNKSLDEIRLNLGIKAFPSDPRAFGVGRSGARFEAGSGQYF